jgi:hypothetical protein
LLEACLIFPTTNAKTVLVFKGKGMAQVTLAKNASFLKFLPKQSRFSDWWP